jgi:hypothetical protein
MGRQTDRGTVRKDGQMDRQTNGPTDGRIDTHNRNILLILSMS